MKHNREPLSIVLVVILVVISIVLWTFVGLCLFTPLLESTSPHVASPDTNHPPFISVIEGPVPIGFSEMRMLSNRITGEKYLFVERSSGGIFVVRVDDK